MTIRPPAPPVAADDYDAFTITTTIAEADAAAAALARLVDVLSAEHPAGDLAASLNCTEADAIADVLRTRCAAGPHTPGSTHTPSRTGPTTSTTPPTDREPPEPTDRGSAPTP
ncbi:hypothetical protein [Clavibacter tessellarius]|uniref:hypothetical protein n=1 Tax=Clavibacter tessellarius TaxID=31965 RepID=UPI003254FBDD